MRKKKSSHLSDKCEASIFSYITVFHAKLDSAYETVLDTEMGSKDVLKE